MLNILSNTRIGSATANTVYAVAFYSKLGYMWLTGSMKPLPLPGGPADTATACDEVCEQSTVHTHNAAIPD